MTHDRAYTRAKDWSKALRKYHIDRDRSAGRWTLYYNNLHQYSKNSIYCSCSLCKAKTNNKHRSSPQGWLPSELWSISDQRKIDNMKDQIKEYL